MARSNARPASEGHRIEERSMGLDSGSVGYIIGDDTPDQVAYQCDDGVTYWKNAR